MWDKNGTEEIDCKTLDLSIYRNNLDMLCIQWQRQPKKVGVWTIFLSW